MAQRLMPLLMLTAMTTPVAWVVAFLFRADPLAWGMFAVGALPPISVGVAFFLWKRRDKHVIYARGQHPRVLRDGPVVYRKM